MSAHTGAPSRQDAEPAFRRDAAELAKHGYIPTTQSWAQGQWGGGAFLIALLLCILLTGLLVFIYMLIVKPDGTLTVTYAKAGVGGAEKGALSGPTSEPASLSGRLAQLDEARSGGLISQQEYEAKRAEVLNGF